MRASLIKPKIFALLLDFLYCCSFTITPDFTDQMAMDIYTMANDFEIELLKEVCTGTVSFDTLERENLVSRMSSLVCGYNLVNNMIHYFI